MKLTLLCLITLSLTSCASPASEMLAMMEVADAKANEARAQGREVCIRVEGMFTLGSNPLASANASGKYVERTSASAPEC